MRRHISILALIAGLVLSVAFVAPVAGVKFTIDELWFPGGTGSHWVYNTPDGGQITVTVVGGTDIGGRRYKVVKESEPLIGAFIGTDPEPFLVFRPEEPALSADLLYRIVHPDVRKYALHLTALLYSSRQIMQMYSTV